jgi:hypothetical protein
MNVILNEPRLLVIDDFLDASEFESVQAAIAFEKYSFVNEGEWRKAWSLLDREPVAGPTYFSSADPEQPLKPAYPTKKPYDYLFRKILLCKDRIETIVGKMGEDWKHFFLRPYLHSVGGGIAWHEDDQMFSGAVTYYCHPKWGAEWGGELLVLAPATATERESTPRPTSNEASTTSNAKTNGDNEQVNSSQEQLEIGDIGPDFWGEHGKKIAAVGIGHFVAPKPNRIVFLSPDCTHRVTRVSPAAGESPRASIAGFFLR